MISANIRKSLLQNELRTLLSKHRALQANLQNYHALFYSYTKEFQALDNWDTIPESEYWERKHAIERCKRMMAFMDKSVVETNKELHEIFVKIQKTRDDLHRVNSELKKEAACSTNPTKAEA